MSGTEEVPKLENLADIISTPLEKEDWIIYNLLSKGMDLLIMGSCKNLRHLIRETFKMIVSITNGRPVFGRDVDWPPLAFTYLVTRGDIDKMQDMADLVHVADNMSATLPFIDIRYLHGDERTSDGICSIINDMSNELVVIDSLDGVKVAPSEMKRFIKCVRAAAGKDVALVFVCTSEYDDVIGYLNVLYPSEICNSVVRVADDGYEVIQDWMY